MRQHNNSLLGFGHDPYRLVAVAVRARQDAAVLAARNAAGIAALEPEWTLAVSLADRGLDTPERTLRSCQ
jgi:hypothetical protein